MTITQAQREAAREITETCGYAAAALTMLPIPGSEILAVMPLHVGMVVKIGQIYGVSLDRDSAMHLIMRIGATVGLSLVGSRIATTFAKVVLPGFGGIISAPFMYASTLAIGRVAECYFESGCCLDDRGMRDVYEDTVRRAKREFDPRRARGDEARRHAEAAAREAPAAPAPTAPAAPAPEAADPVARLERLAKLRDAGAITPEEFELAKRKVLGEL